MLLFLQSLLGFAIVVGFFVFLGRRYWRGRHRIAQSLGLGRKAPYAATPRAPADPLTLFDGARVEHIGELDVPTGSLVMCDPLVFPEDRPFQRTIAPGRYRVDVAVIDIEPGHQRIAALRLVVGDGTPSSYEDAGDFGVDAGVGCVMDVAAQNVLVAEMERFEHDRNGNYYDDVLAKELEPDRDWTLHYPVANRRENVAIVHSGWGDGIYGCYWVLDATGAPLWLVADFDVRRTDLASARVVDKGERRAR